MCKHAKSVNPTYRASLPSSKANMLPSATVVLSLWRYLVPSVGIRELNISMTLWVQVWVLVGHVYMAEQSWGCSQAYPAHLAEGRHSQDMLPGNFWWFLPCNKCCPRGSQPSQQPPSWACSFRHSKKCLSSCGSNKATQGALFLGITTYIWEGRKGWV